MSEKRTLYGVPIRAPYDISHLLHIYAPHRRDEYIISKEDFVENSIGIYGSQLPLFRERAIKEGTLIGAMFKESEDALSDDFNSYKLVTDNSSEERGENAKNKGEIFTKNYTQGENISTSSKEEVEASSQNTEELPLEEGTKTSSDEVNAETLQKTYDYPSLYYESPYIEVISATFDDEKGRLDITLKTQDSALVSSVIASVLGIDEKNVRVNALQYSSDFDEYFLSSIYASVIAAKAAEKFGANIKYMYRPSSTSPSLSIKRISVVDKEAKAVKSESIEVNVNAGDALLLEEHVANILFSSAKPLYPVEKLEATINLVPTSDSSTLFFSSYLKAAASSSSLEHAYEVAFLLDEEPLLFIERNLGSISNGVEESFTSLMKSEDAYIQSSIFALNDSRKGVLLSSISALNKAQSVSFLPLDSGFPLSFEEKNDFAFGAVKDEETGDLKLYAGTTSSLENKSRLDDAIETLKNNVKGQDCSLYLRSLSKEKGFTIGPDIMRRHTSVVLNAIKNAILQKKIRTDFSTFNLVKNVSDNTFLASFWGAGVFSGYRDFVTDELVITSIHITLLHSSSFEMEDDRKFYKRAVLKVLSLLNVRFSSNFENDDNLKVDFVESPLCFDAAEGVFALVLSSLRTLSLLLSPGRKMLKDKKSEKKDEGKEASENPKEEEEKNAP